MEEKQNPLTILRSSSRMLNHKRGGQTLAPVLSTHDPPSPPPGPPSVRTTPWRSLLSFVSLMTGDGRATWICCCGCLENGGPMWFMCGAGWVMLALWLVWGEGFWHRVVPLDTTSGPWMHGKLGFRNMLNHYAIHDLYSKCWNVIYRRK